MNIAIILACGVGSRVGADIPKQLIEVQGKPIKVYTMQIYQQHPDIDAIEEACHASYMDYLHQLYLSKGYQSNMKITTKEDLKMFESWILS